MCLALHLFSDPDHALCLSTDDYDHLCRYFNARVDTETNLPILFDLIQQLGFPALAICRTWRFYQALLCRLFVIRQVVDLCSETIDVTCSQQIKYYALLFADQHRVFMDAIAHYCGEHENEFGVDIDGVPIYCQETLKGDCIYRRDFVYIQGDARPPSSWSDVCRWFHCKMTPYICHPSKLCDQIAGLVIPRRSLICFALGNYKNKNSIETDLGWRWQVYTCSQTQTMLQSFLRDSPWALLFLLQEMTMANVKTVQYHYHALCTMYQWERYTSVVERICHEHVRPCLRSDVPVSESYLRQAITETKIGITQKYNPAHAILLPLFDDAALCQEWIREFFSIEPQVYDICSDPACLVTTGTGSSKDDTWVNPNKKKNKRSKNTQKTFVDGMFRTECRIRRCPKRTPCLRYRMHQCVLFTTADGLYTNCCYCLRQCRFKKMKWNRLFYWVCNKCAYTIDPTKSREKQSIIRKAPYAFLTRQGCAAW